MIFKLNGTTLAIVNDYPEKFKRKDYLEQYARHHYGQQIGWIDVSEINYDVEKQIVDFIGDLKNIQLNKDWLK